jgi:hypothetical protein
MDLTFDPELTWEVGLTYYSFIFAIPLLVYIALMAFYIANALKFAALSSELPVYRVIGGVVMINIVDMILHIMCVISVSSINESWNYNWSLRKWQLWHVH